MESLVYFVLFVVQFLNTTTKSTKKKEITEEQPPEFSGWKVASGVRTKWQSGFEVAAYFWTSVVLIS
jgi:hypothetical protein